jgi:hypothetical protein
MEDLPPPVQGPTAKEKKYVSGNFYDYLSLDRLLT